MSQAKGRPDDMVYIHSNGTKAKIAFLWGDQDNPVPKGLDITIRFAAKVAHDFKFHCEHVEYQNMDQARKQGLILAEGIIDLLNEPLG